MFDVVVDRIVKGSNTKGAHEVRNSNLARDSKRALGIRSSYKGRMVNA
jgi:hypothetical protein